MAKAYSDDLRCKLLTAYDRGQGSLRAFAELFSVSYDWAKKVSRQRLRSPQMERVAQSRHGVMNRALASWQQDSRASHLTETLGRGFNAGDDFSYCETTNEAPFFTASCMRRIASTTSAGSS